MLLGGSLPVVLGSNATHHVGKSVKFRRGRAAVMNIAIDRSNTTVLATAGMGR